MKNILLLALPVVMAQAAAASETTICQTDRLMMTASPLADIREFTCGNGMSGKASDLFKKGWSVVAVHVRQNPPSDMSSWQQGFMVLKKD